MGFEKEVAHIMNFIQSQTHTADSVSCRQQTVLLSATLSTDVKRLASVTLQKPVIVDVASDSCADVVRYLV